ncbi:hypothetical protein HJG44_07575 [Enterovirga sp. DB1703]|uniref:Exo-alpha-sialidase n=2 Tax=Enterovirga aerilata TaxID=2730920 RepID=A0A849I3P1_9HYPH|nr:hypothetical protein [Enterovirga sp. DB1703]NNM72254.1 hypothetical protein [Enterovirga sp. DB1703]
MRRAGAGPLLLLSAALAAGQARAAGEPPLAAVTLVGGAETVFSAMRDACDGDDVPDAPARAFRDAEGGIVMFGLHTKNRALRGPDFARLRIDCTPAMPSKGDPDPAAYDDASWIAATWTEDGRRVEALVHHEYQANTHPGRCSRKEYLACWYNTVVAVSSRDGGRSFDRPEPPKVVAAAPFRQEVGQGRHRGFFNPSNIFGQGRSRYFLSSTTGWAGQEGGACLFRTSDPSDPSSWRAFDGTGFSLRFGDPYRDGAGTKPCRTIWPFPAPVGSVVRHRPSGAWIAVFQASANADLFPEAGFYTTSSRDLLTWDKPRLLLAGRTLYDDPCTSGGRLISYPSLIDPEAEGRNFDDVGASAQLYYATLRVDGCQITSDRDLQRRRVAIQVWP